MLPSDASSRLMSSVQFCLRVSSILFCGRKESSSRIDISNSSSVLKCVTPLLLLCVMAPPSSSLLTSSWITVFTTSGPVTNIWLFSFTIKMKSVSAGE